jgi:hypothetical protein
MCDLRSLNASLTQEERKQKVLVHPQDPGGLSAIYNLNFGEIHDIASRLKDFRALQDKEGKQQSNLHIWNSILDSYIKWAMPEDETIDQMAVMTRMLKGQFLYGGFANPPLDYPEIQLQRMFAAPVVRELKTRTQTQAHRNLCTKIFVFKIELVPYHTTEQWDSETQTLDDNSAPVFRIVSCFGGMTLDNLHDRVLGPAMGFTRHYHSYRFIARQNGASFGPQNSGAIDSMHTETDYDLDDTKYCLAHVLRNTGDKLSYIYDMGDNWKHRIVLQNIVESGDTVTIEEMKTETNPDGQIQIHGTQLLYGAINGPPEDSCGCNGMGKYYNILKYGPACGSSPHSEEANAMNWRAHNILNAYEFNLGAHQQRLANALSGKKSEKGGHRMYHAPMPGMGGLASSMFGNSMNNIKGGTRNIQKGMMQERVSVKPDAVDVAVCAQCGRQPNVDVGEKKLVRCSSCKAAWYCNSVCQKKHWSTHKVKCKALKNERKAFKKFGKALSR